MKLTRSLLACSLAAGLTAPALGQVVVQEIFSEAEAANGDASLTLLETVTVGPDGTAYAILRDTSSTIVGGINSFDGTSFTTVMTPAQYQATGSNFDYAAGNGVGVVGGVVRGVSFFDNNVYEVDTMTGVVSQVVAPIDISIAAGLTANLSAVHETATDGTIYAVESQSDQVLAISPTNTVSVEIDSTNFASLLGGVSIGGIGVNGDTLYLGSNSNDELYAWDVVANAGSLVLSTAQIEAVTDDIDGTVSFGDIYYAPDGLVYFYEGDSDYLLSFNPLDAANTIAAVVTEAEFNAGPASDTINQLSFFNGQIAWTDAGLGYYTIPEPTTAALLGLSGLAMLRRRRSA